MCFYCVAVDLFFILGKIWEAKIIVVANSLFSKTTFHGKNRRCLNIDIGRKSFFWLVRPRDALVRLGPDNKASLVRPRVWLIIDNEGEIHMWFQSRVMWVSFIELLICRFKLLDQILMMRWGSQIWHVWQNAHKHTVIDSWRDAKREILVLQIFNWLFWSHDCDFLKQARIYFVISFIWLDLLLVSQRSPHPENRWINIFKTLWGRFWKLRS